MPRLLLFVLAVSAIAHDTRAGLLYGSTNFGELVSIDPDAGTATLIGDAVTPPGRAEGWGWSDIAFSPNGTLFGVSRSQTETTGGCTGFYTTAGCSQLYTIDPATGLITSELGSTDTAFVSDIEFLPDGTLLGSLYANDTQFDAGALVSIDPALATAAPIGKFGSGLENGGLSVDPTTGLLWGVESSFAFAAGQPQPQAHLFQVDPVTGLASNILQLTFGGATTTFGLDGFEILADGRFFATRAARDGGGVELYQINPLAGPGEAELTLIPLTIDSSIGGRINGLASRVPEPGALSLLSLGLAALIVRKRGATRAS